jgi:hypothetical protein
MSIEIMNAVWRHSTASGRQRLVLLAIADHQGEIGAWPSLKTLAKMVNASERTIQRDIQELQKMGELQVEVQNAPTKSQYKSNLYWVTVSDCSDGSDFVALGTDKSGVTESDSGVTNTTAGVTESQPGVTTVVVQTLIEPLKETLNIDISPEVEILDSDFELFWAQYPRRVDKIEAKSSFTRALKRADAMEIIAGARIYANSISDLNFAAYPAKWLERDGWRENPPPRQKTEEEEIEIARLERIKAREATQRLLAEQEEAMKDAAPPPTCTHGVSIARICHDCRKSNK